MSNTDRKCLAFCSKYVLGNFDASCTGYCNMDKQRELAERLSGLSAVSKSLSGLASSEFNRPFDDLYTQELYVPQRSPMLDLADHSMSAASNHCRSLAYQIQEIEARLDKQSAIAFWVAGGPSGQAFFPMEIYAEDPDRMVFKGVDENNNPFVLVQHVSQLNIAIRVAKLSKGETRHPIGFHIPK